MDAWISSVAENPGSAGGQLLRDSPTMGGMLSDPNWKNAENSNDSRKSTRLVTAQMRARIVPSRCLTMEHMSSVISQDFHKPKTPKMKAAESVSREPKAHSQKMGNGQNNRLKSVASWGLRANSHQSQHKLTVIDYGPWSPQRGPVDLMPRDRLSHSGRAQRPWAYVYKCQNPNILQHKYRPENPMESSSMQRQTKAPQASRLLPTPQHGGAWLSSNAEISVHAGHDLMAHGDG